MMPSLIQSAAFIQSAVFIQIVILIRSAAGKGPEMKPENRIRRKNLRHHRHGACFEQFFRARPDAQQENH